MPAKRICPECLGKYRIQDFERHVARHSDPTFVPTVRDPATVDELQAAGLSRPEAAAHSPEQRRAEEAIIMAGADPVTQDQLRIRDLETQVTGLTEQLASANSHQRLGNILSHAAEACVDCRQDLDQHNQRIIKSALEGLDPAAARELALAKGVIPQTLTFQV